jgi:hypothetical protein
VQAPPGQFHESPTDQYWNGLPNDQTIMNAGTNQINTNPFPPNCNINNNLNASGDYDGIKMDDTGGWS